MAKKDTIKTELQKRRMPQVLREAIEAGKQEEARKAAERDQAITELGDQLIKQSRDQVITGSRDANRRKQISMTFYMDDGMRKAWKKYEAAQEESGRRVSFQGTIEAYLRRLLRDYLNT